MTTFASFIAWLFGLPPVIRLTVTAGRMLLPTLQLLSNRSGEPPRNFSIPECVAIERTLQAVEALLARAIWLRARQIAGLPQPDHPRPLRTIPSRRPPGVRRLTQRAARLADRLTALERHASRLATTMATAHDIQVLQHPPHPLGAVDHNRQPTARPRPRVARGKIALAPKTGPPDPSAHHIPI